MPLSLRRGTVSAIVERHEGLVRLEVDGEPCVAYPRLTGPVALGDDVLVNVQAVALALGSGGFHVLHANLTRGVGLEPDPGAHVMTLPYTPLQTAVRHAEEDAPVTGPLAGLPVVCCSLHSQLAPVCAGLADARVAYVQVAGGALPVSLSDTVRLLKARGLLEVAVAAAPCIDGDVQCANVWSALNWCADYDAIVCAVGPGVAGTGTRLGHGGLGAAEAANAALALAGAAIIAPRYSDRDERERHRGVSHHTQEVWELSFRRPVIAWPIELDPPPWMHPARVATDGWREACAGLPLSHMGRRPDEDPWFFAAAFAAGKLARGLLP